MSKLLLAPMDGVIDFIMRDLLTQIGGIDIGFTEFLRITDKLLPNTSFFKICPELKMNSRTRSGIPIHLQLLGGQPSPLADNAARACELGAAGIDLNFGCPAKTVNRHDGGAYLLNFPHRLFEISKKVKESIPLSIPLSAKIRLGDKDTHLIQENILALCEGGVSFITVHCRTKLQGYKPPAHWELAPLLQEVVKIPIVVNGDIFSHADLKKCQQITSATQFMIGRGALSDPYLFWRLKNSIDDERISPSWIHIKSLLIPFYNSNSIYLNHYYATSRIKQWLSYLSKAFPQAHDLFQEIKQVHPDLFQNTLEKMLS